MADPDPASQDLVAVLTARVEALEGHVAHLEAAQQDMSDMLSRQWTEIDKLARTLELLHGRLQQVEPEPENRPPPHW